MEPGDKLLSSMSEVTIDAPICTVIAMFSESDLFKEWMPNVIYTEPVKELSHYRRLHHIKQHMPWPVANRDMVVRTSGMFEPEDKSLICVMKSVTEPTFFGATIPPPDKGHVRMNIERGYHYFKYLGVNKTKYIGIMNVDPNLPMVPDKFINYLVKNIAYGQVKVMLKKLTKNKGKTCPFTERVKSRGGYY